jgi:hypothetical protein
MDLNLIQITPKVLANASGVVSNWRRYSQGRNPGLELANTSGVIGSHSLQTETK